MAQDKVAIITGGGTGIGQSAALALAGDGWNVVVTGRRKEELDKTVAMAGEGQGKIVAIAADITKAEEVKRLFAETIATFGRLDFLFNNAGMGAPAVPMEELPLEKWQAVVDVNLTAAFMRPPSAVSALPTSSCPQAMSNGRPSSAMHLVRPVMACLVVV